MAHKCTTSGCSFYLPDNYPLRKCPWHAAPGRGPVKIAAAIAIAAAGLSGGIAYKRFREYLQERKLRQQREEWRKKYSNPAEEAKRTASKNSKRKSKSPTRRKRQA
jgi:hypothetical protein